MPLTLQQMKTKPLAENFLSEQMNSYYRKKLNTGSLCEKDFYDYLMKNAWNDAMAREHYKRNSTIVENKAIIIEILTNELKKNIKSILSDFDKWHDELCKNTTYGMTYGIWQKFINMSFKYMYCIYLVTDGAEFRDFILIWDKCHMPLDSYILNWYKRKSTVKAELSSIKTITWNGLIRDDYLLIRDDIRNILGTPINYKQYNGNPTVPTTIDLPTTALDAEFIIWEGEKNIVIHNLDKRIFG